MSKDLVIRKCSHCGHNGHNSRTCNGKVCIKLFGYNIEMPDDTFNDRIKSIRRTKSAGSLQSLDAESSGAAAAAAAAAASGYHSDADDKKKGKLWTEEEHRWFLLGLEKLGKGDWRGISKCYVPTRTPTQVASHAQKYFIRMATLEKKKRRTSVFDININELDANSTSPEHLAYPETNSEPLSMLSSSNQATIKFETSTHVVPSSERPPLSPSMRYTLGLNTPTMPYMVGQASSISPAFSYVPMMNFPVAPSNSVHLPTDYNNVKFASAGCTLPHEVEPPPPVTAMSMNKKDWLDLSLGGLSI